MELSKKLASLIILFFCSSTEAASLGVWPINPRIDAPASSTMIWVKNNSKTDTVVLQARVFVWKQVDNKDEFEAQDDLVVSPPIIEVKTDTQQIFRVINRKGVVNNFHNENSYRLLIDEVPKEGSAQASELRFQMRYSLPLFVGLPNDYVNKPMPARLKMMETGLRYRVIEKPSPFIEVTNLSPVHVRLSNVTIYNSEPIEKTSAISKWPTRLRSSQHYQTLATK